MGSIYAEYLDTRASVDSRALQELQLRQSLEPKLNIWNARLNPPDAPSSIGDLRLKSIALADRNDLVERLETEPEKYEDLIAEIQYLDDEEPLFGKLNLDPEKPYSEQEVRTLQS